MTTATLQATSEQIEWLKQATDKTGGRPVLERAWTFEHDNETWLGCTDSHRIHAIKHPPVDGYVNIDDMPGTDPEGPPPALADHIITPTPHQLEITGIDLVSCFPRDLYLEVKFEPGSTVFGPDGQGPTILGDEIPPTLYRKEDEWPLIEFAESGFSTWLLGADGSAPRCIATGSRPDIPETFPVVAFNSKYLIEAAGQGGGVFNGVDGEKPWWWRGSDRLAVVMPTKIHTPLEELENA